MTRLLSTAICLALLAVTVGAFALTEKAKLQPSPISKTLVAPKVFSPVCRCTTSSVLIRFHLRRADTLSVWMERDGKRVTTLASGRHYPEGFVELRFTGKSPDGHVLPQGTYEPVVHFGRSHLTMHLPQPAWVRLDTKPPRMRVRRHLHAVVSPGCDCARSDFSVAYRLTEPGHGLLFVNGRRVERTRGLKLAGTLTWDGRTNGVPVRAGTYTLSASAQDEAGNRAKPVAVAVVTVRYITLARTRIQAKPRARFAVGVVTEAHGYSWLFNGTRGTAHGRTLKLRAPKRKGVYRLYVEEAGHSARALVVVG